MKRAKASLLYVVAILIGSGVGFATAWWKISYAVQKSVYAGPWVTNPQVGGRDESMYLRAQLKNGMLTLPLERAVYYVADRDENGDPLSCDCTYRLEGTDIPAQWWAIAAYGSDLQLIKNDANRYSVNSQDVARNEDGGWTIYLSAEPKDRNWIPISPPGKRFDLVLRIYEPDTKLLRDLSGAPVPRIVKEGCGDG